MWFNFKVILIVFLVLKITQGLNIILPRPEIDDPFKDNPKWEEFKLVQIERLGRLKTLVNNVWNFVDSISYLGPKISFKESFIRFHFRAFQDFLLETQNRLRDGNPFSIINPSIGLYNIANLLKNSNDSPNDILNKFRTKWAEVDFMTLIIHQIFNKTTETILQSGKNTEEKNLIEIFKDVYYVNFTDDNDNEFTKAMNLDEIGAKIDREMTSLGNGSHLIRGLVQILRNIKQSDVDITEYMNYFCYGNNKFGIIPELLDLLSDSVHYLIIADLKKLILDVYFVALPMFSNDSKAKVKDNLPHRNLIWDKMYLRVQRKLNFAYLNGQGWGTSAAPVIFKCDIAPEIDEIHGQWGRNITTGVSPLATKTFTHDFQSGPLGSDGQVGYLDDRSPIIQAVGFQNSFQGYIESELVLSRPGPSCVGTCEDYMHESKICEGEDQRCELYRSYHCDDKKKTCMRKSTCPALTRNCVRASRNVTMCPSLDPTKRYDWINLGGEVLKQSNELNSHTVRSHLECSSGPPISAFERWQMENSVILNAPEYCELCLCTCMTPQNEEDQMYFDIQPTKSDASVGMLVSAIRFVKEGNVIRLAVEQGKPLIQGFIDESTLKWVEPLPFDKQDVSKTIPIGPNGFMKINIDLIIGEVGNVLTGIRFHREHDSIGLEIQTTPIHWPENDPTQITLKTAESTWKRINHQTSPREPVGFYKPGNPNVQRGPSMPDSILNTFVEFTTTTYEEDLAQTVIPLFDTQPVFYYEGRRWLRGVGTMHKGKPGSGGFIAPLIVPARPYIAMRYFPIPP